MRGPSADGAADPLRGYFERRGVPLKELCEGVTTPLRFGDPHEEHWATRRAAGLFDFSFMACFELAGPGALDYLHAVQTRDARALAPGSIAYTLLCREDGTVLNDATIWRHEPGKWWLFTGRRADREHLEGIAPQFDVVFADRSVETVVLAVQGPRSLDILRSGAANLGAIPYFRLVDATLFGCACQVARIGYSGETGYEVVTQRACAPLLWESLAAAGRAFGLRECGFEATDSLRIEAGHILFANELSLRVTPYELGLERLVALHRTECLGAAALQQLRYRAPIRKLVGLQAARAAPARDLRAAAEHRHTPTVDATAIVTSSCRSPVFERDLALGFVPWEQRHVGTLVRLEDATFARVARLPFYDPPKVLPRSRV